MGSARPLTSREHDLVALLLPPGGFLGVEVYRAQLGLATVSGSCDCGCATVYLDVDRAAPRMTPVEPVDAPLPFEARGKDPADPNLPIEIVLLVRDGALASLEIVYYGDTPPLEFPDPADLEVVKLR